MYFAKQNLHFWRMWEIKNLSNELTLIISFLKLFQRNQTPQRNVVPQNNDDDEESPLVINEEPEMKRGRHENLPTSGSLPQLPVSSQFPAMPSNMPAGFNQYMLLQVIIYFTLCFHRKILILFKRILRYQFTVMLSNMVGFNQCNVHVRTCCCGYFLSLSKILNFKKWKFAKMAL